MRTPWNYLFASLILILGGCVSKGPRFDPQEPDSAAHGVFEPLNVSNRLDSAFIQAPTSPFRVGPGDVIEVEALGESGSRSALTVGPDGKVYYSLLPGVSVWGLTLGETKALLEQEIARFSRLKPDLIVNLRSVGSQRMWVLGSVAKPGVYTLGTPVTLLEAIGGAGGIPSLGGSGELSADLPNSFVMRNGEYLPVDFDRLVTRGDMSQNVYLQPDDFVYLRPLSSPSVYVLGAVSGPNIYPYSRDLSVATALVSAGGTLKYAQKSKVLVIRGGLTHPRIAEVNFDAIVRGRMRDVPLAPGDIVFVPYTPFKKVAELAEQVLGQFVRTVAVNEGQNLVDDRRDPVGISVPGGGIFPGQ